MSESRRRKDSGKYNPLTLQDLRNKIVIVTGAAGGLGSVIFLKLLAEGSLPVGIDPKSFQNSELADRLTETTYKNGADFLYFQGSAADEAAMRSVLAQFTLIHGLVNCAGLLGADNEVGGSLVEVFKKMHEAHVLTTLIMTILTIEKMIKGSSIVDIGSIETTHPAGNVSAYVSAQGAKRGLTFAHSVTYGRRGIRVNMISPGLVLTRANEQRYAGMADGGEQELAELKGRTLLELVTPEQVANWVLWLLSDMSNGITGQEFIVDGGFSRPLVSQ